MLVAYCWMMTHLIRDSHTGTILAWAAARAFAVENQLWIKTSARSLLQGTLHTAPLILRTVHLACSSCGYDHFTLVHLNKYHEYLS